MFGRTKKRRSNCDEIALEESHDTKTYIPVTLNKDETVGHKNLKKAALVIGQFIGQIDYKVSKQNRLLVDILGANHENLKRIEACFDTASDCQKLTSELANQNLERHALYPAIMAVDALAETIMKLAKQAYDLLCSQQLDESSGLLANSIIDAAKVAETKMLQLQITQINPDSLDDLDCDCHQLVKVVSTTDPDQHKKVKETVKSGLFYNGVVLRQAKVTAYRFNSDNDAVEK
ncbi:MAG: hypothetical protein K9M75_05170 [Phycisphaerae bacterium]|nr:hypothetical protein [Phycisphaerae bacterium]